jgi:hypothetical protein
MSSMFKDLLVDQGFKTLWSGHPRPTDLDRGRLHPPRDLQGGAGQNHRRPPRAADRGHLGRRYHLIFDGQFFRSAKRGDAAGDANARYGRDPGFIFYTHLSDQHGPYSIKVMSATSHEAPYVLDGGLICSLSSPIWRGPPWAKGRPKRP